ncbi:DUF2213 domain-containing protein [Escherichia coli]|uniref:DUF2213 domain-containing protein n=1 Tax=Escherichia fergusonii TaxID=564 RepID=UPI0015EA3458|nr:DUF2213 domain-containing protein [Escherichia fergusonii]MBI1074418.1 DUF2213 domain-containing protein [Escherichia coli]MCN2350108.1 DUF2213 domain-containing protein [Escherichia coli]MCN2497794.1 DUF2213 domain-containing protein [Escherichia coli]QMC78172.1 DUF2213 domain-containing protein [Escherichia fergusonii]HCO7573143.1 DUF2213 domain-containing protein [Escherichia fergusonii]
MTGQSQRIYDLNNWFEIPKNPISKVGVFPYMGATIGAPEPDKIYMVCRPAEALADPECLQSFRLLPFINDHEMLGEGETPAEQYGVEGVIGESVVFEGDENQGTLYANLKVFSQRLAELIADGKKELSCGYRCVYEFRPGTWNGQPYDYVQLKIRGNHIALVDEGRMGPTVAVLDHFKFTIDSSELKHMAEPGENKEGQDGDGDGAGEGDMTLAQCAAAIKQIMPIIQQFQSAQGANPAAATPDEEAPPEGEKPAVPPEEQTGDEDVPPEEKAAQDAAIKKLRAEIRSTRSAMDGFKKDGMKMLMGQIARRDTLAEQLSHHIGAFDHREKTLDEVAKYGVKKLGINCADGMEEAVLLGYLHARPVNYGGSDDTTYSAADAADSDEITKYLGGK